MENKEKFIYEYCLLRYVPDLERGEFINIGLLMMCKRMRWLRSDIIINSARILSFCNRADLKRLEQQCTVFKMADVPSPNLPVEEKFRWMASVKSAIIQTSPTHPGIIYSEMNYALDELESKFNELFSKLVK